MSHPVLVLDLDGTLADTARDLVPALNRVIATHRLSPVRMGEVGHVVGHGAKAMIARAFELRGRPLDKATHEDLFERFLDHYRANIARRTVLFEGAAACLDAFQEAGWRLAVCTNKSESLALRLLEKLDVTKRFAAVSGGDTYPFKKPDPRHVLETVRQAGGTPAHAVMVGDSSNDIDASRAAGIASVAVSFGYCDRPAAELGADIVIDHFDALRPEVATGLIAALHG